MGELILLLHNVSLQVDRNDRWLRTLETSKQFSVRSVYKYLTAQLPIVTPVPVSSLWHKDNLFRRSFIDQNSLEYVAGCGIVETSDHLLLHCKLFGYVWHLIYGWLGIYTAAHQSLTAHFTQFNYVGGSSKDVCQSILQVIWYAIVWELWKERNNRLFIDINCSVIQLVEKIKSLIFMWLKAKFTTLPFNFHGWCLSPFIMLGIG
jgi:hypothetical protein